LFDILHQKIIRPKKSHEQQGPWPSNKKKAMGGSIIELPMACDAFM